MLRWRLVVAAILIIPLLTLIWIDDQANAGRPGIWLGPVALIIGVMACHEVNAIFRYGKFSVSATPNLLASFSVLAFSLVPLLWSQYPIDCPLGKPGWTLIGMAVAIALIFSCELVRFRQPGESLSRLATGIFAATYTGLLMSFLIQIRYLHSNRVGLIALVATILLVTLAETGAYFVGRSMGRHKLAPHRSPGKTIEGLMGGIGAAMLGGWAVHSLILPNLAGETQTGSLGWFMLYAVTLCLAGVLGDLAESMLKREVGQKDSSNWLPGMGGVLDLTDSMLSTAPVSFAWWASGMLILA